MLDRSRAKFGHFSPIIFFAWALTGKVMLCAYGGQALQVPQAQQAVVQAVPLRLVPQGAPQDLA